jgi:hypothetical protein
MKAQIVTLTLDIINNYNKMLYIYIINNYIKILFIYIINM